VVRFVLVSSRTPIPAVTQRKRINGTEVYLFFLKQLCTMSNIDALSINTIRALAADITFEANSGHPGTRSIPCLMAAIVYSVKTKFYYIQARQWAVLHWPMFYGRTLFAATQRTLTIPTVIALFSPMAMLVHCNILFSICLDMT